MNRLLVALVLAGASCTGISARGTASGQEALHPFVALCVGVDKYASPNVNSVIGCKGSAAALASRFGGPDASPALADEAATKSTILLRLEKLVELATDDSRVLIFLSGHGVRRAGEWSFCPHDYDPDDFQNTALHGRELSSALFKLLEKGARVLVVLDSCHSGEFVEDHGGLFEPLPQFRGELVVIAAAMPSQTSVAGFPYTLFSQQILDAFSPAADVPFAYGDPVGISISEVRRRLSKELRSALRKNIKPPGMSWREQQFAMEWSASLADTEVLVDFAPLRDSGLPRRSLFDSFGDDERAPFAIEPPVPVLSEADAARSIVGAWGMETPLFVYSDGAKVALTDANGEPLQATQLLVFDDRGNYFSSQRLGHDEPTVTAGRYVFEEGQTFRLEYENGVDVLSLERLSDDELVFDFDSRQLPAGAFRAMWGVQTHYELRRLLGKPAYPSP